MAETFRCLILELLQPDVIAFIKDHEQSDVNQLLLKYKEIHGVPTSLVADQINGRQKAKYKLPSFYRSGQVVYPPAVNLEQSSSEITATFKLRFIQKNFGSQLLNQGADLSGGFGIDALFLSRAFHEYHFVEPNTQLIKVARHNHQSLEAKNIAYENLTAEGFLNVFQGKLDFVYVDPSRRSKDNRKIFSLSDCEPDIVALQTAIFKKTDRLLIKASPLLDISIALKEIQHVKNVAVVSVDNECKELLLYGEAGFHDSPVIQAVMLAEGKETKTFEFSIVDEQQAEVQFSPAKQYLYEPDASILKAGAFKLIAERYALSKVHMNTHLYTSDDIVNNFPGKIFRIIKAVKADPREIGNIFTDGKANVTTRNYPLTVEELRKKTKLKDGGEKFLIGFTEMDRKSLVAAERIQ